MLYYQKRSSEEQLYRFCYRGCRCRCFCGAMATVAAGLGGLTSLKEQKNNRNGKGCEREEELENKQRMEPRGPSRPWTTRDSLIWNSDLPAKKHQPTIHKLCLHYTKQNVLMPTSKVPFLRSSHVVQR